MPVKKKEDEADALIVQLAIMGNGVEKHCIKKGSTIGELFDQAERKMGETVRMNGIAVKEDDEITKDGSTITSTAAVKGGM